MVTINSNYAASFAANAAKQTQNSLNGAMEKLSSGKRINFAKDDAAGSALAMRLSAEISGLSVASRNASDGQAFIDTADGALKERGSAGGGWKRNIILNGAFETECVPLTQTLFAKSGYSFARIRESCYRCSL